MAESRKSPHEVLFKVLFEMAAFDVKWRNIEGPLFATARRRSLAILRQRTGLKKKLNQDPLEPSPTGFVSSITAPMVHAAP